MDHSIQNAAAKPLTELASSSLNAFSRVALIKLPSFFLNSVCDI